ncbi:MAG: amino acid racemase [Lachnospiraceae bacterium]|nr:amino acid racemase [Lachnospiraceae bacterium]
MKKIGLIGGTGPESTLMYYKELNKRTDELTNGKEMPDIAIESVNFRKAWDYVASEKYDLLADYLAEKAKSLVDSGSEVTAMTAVTMHMVFDEVCEKAGADLVSIPEALKDEILQRGIRKVALFGTIFTMEQDYMKTPLLNAGIEVFVPEKEDRDLIAKRILEELELGIVKESTLAEFVKIINKMKEEKGIEALILGCTELPLLLNSDNCPVICLDSVEIHLQKLIKLAME